MAAKKNGNGKNGNGNGAKKRGKGRPPRLWSAKELRDILNDVRGGATIADLARTNNCCRNTIYKLISRKDFINAYLEAEENAVARADFTMFSEGIGGRETTKTVVETDDCGNVMKTAVTTETAAPNIHALGRWLAAKRPKQWSEKHGVQVEADETVASFLSKLADAEAKGEV